MLTLTYRIESLNLEKLQAKAEHYNKRNNVEISGISNQIPNDDLVNHVVEICKNSNVLIMPADIKGCHRLPLVRNGTTDNICVILKFVNRKHSKLMLFSKKSVSSKSKVDISHSLCPYYRYIWGKCKDLQKESKVSQGFSLEVVVTIRVTENGSPMKILQEKDLMAIHQCPHEVQNNSLRLYNVPIISWAASFSITVCGWNGSRQLFWRGVLSYVLRGTGSRAYQLLSHVFISCKIFILVRQSRDLILLLNFLLCYYSCPCSNTITFWLFVIYLFIFFGLTYYNWSGFSLKKRR